VLIHSHRLKGDAATPINSVFVACLFAIVHTDDVVLVAVVATVASLYVVAIVVVFVRERENAVSKPSQPSQQQKMLSLFKLRQDWQEQLFHA
jgi:hypothetical protein